MVYRSTLNWAHCRFYIPKNESERNEHHNNQSHAMGFSGDIFYGL